MLFTTSFSLYVFKQHEGEHSATWFSYIFLKKKNYKKQMSFILILFYYILHACNPK